MKYLSIYSIALSIICIVSCNEPEKKLVEKKSICVSDSMQSRIQLDTAARTYVSNNLQLTGEVGFDENKVVKIFPFTSGQVVEVKVSLGDKVSAGQVLAVIKSADIAGNYSDLKTTASDIAIAKRQLANTRLLFDKGISSEKELEEAKENLQKAVITNQKIQHSLQINGSGNTNAMGIYTVKAPISGYVVEKKANAGNFIRLDNTDNLFTISSLKEVWVWANVFETDISHVKEGYAAIVKTLAYPDKLFYGKVDKISEVLNPDNKVMRIRITIPNEAQMLKPEMFANVTIENTEKLQSVSIPIDAMVFEGGKNYVVIYKGKCALSLAEVKISKTENNLAYISSGLNAGDIIISKNQVLFYNAILENQ